MKKTATILILMAGVFIMATGCSGQENGDEDNLYTYLFNNSVKVFKPNPKLIVNDILDFKSYVFNDLKNLGINCPAKNSEAKNLLEKIKEETILEKHIAEESGYIILSYIVPNKDNIKDAYFKSIFEGCSGDVQPFAAKKDYLVFGTEGCTQEDKLLLSKCQNLMSRVNNYLKINTI